VKRRLDSFSEDFVVMKARIKSRQRLNFEDIPNVSKLE